MKRLAQKATDTERATLTLKTRISNMLRPMKHLLYVKSKQLLTFVPDGQGRHNCTADPRDSGQGPRKTNSPCAKTFMFTWKSHSKGRSCKTQFSSSLRRETASPAAYNCLPRTRHLFWWLHLGGCTSGSSSELAREDGGRSRHDRHHHRTQVQCSQMSLAFLQLLSTLLCKLTNRVRLGGAER